MAIDDHSTRILLTGGHGFLGRAVARALAPRPGRTTDLVAPRSGEFDLRDPRAAQRLFEIAGADIVVHCAGLVGGLALNREQPARMFYDNMAMAINIIDQWRARCERSSSARQRGVLIFIGSMTSYPATAPMPLREESLWTGPLDPLSAAYGTAKLAALEYLQACFRQHGTPSLCLIPTNLYGPGDNLDDPAKAHAAGTLIRRFVDAAREDVPSVECWGSGSPRRQFLFVEDAALGVVHAIERAENLRDARAINLAPPIEEEVTIRELTELIARLAGYHGEVKWDSTKPEGQARRSLDASRAAEMLEWRTGVSLEEGMRRTIEWYRRRGGAPMSPG